MVKEPSRMDCLANNLRPYSEGKKRRNADLFNGKT